MRHRQSWHRHQNRRLGIAGALAAMALVASAGTAAALPRLQLGPGSYGGWSYDVPSQTHVASDPSLELAAYATLSAWQTTGSLGINRYAYLVVSAVPMINFDGFDITVSGDSGLIGVYTSGYGAPPLNDINDLAPHGIFDTYYEIYEFRFDGALGVIPDTIGLEAPAPGLSEIFTITLNSLGLGVSGVHMDLFTLQDSTLVPIDQRGKMILPDPPPGPTVNTVYSSSAPFNRDAQTTGAPIPEPSATLLFGAGCLVAGMAGRARRGAR